MTPIAQAPPRAHRYYVFTFHRCGMPAKVGAVNSFVRFAQIAHNTGIDTEHQHHLLGRHAQ